MVDQSMSQAVFDAVYTCTGLALMCLLAATTLAAWKMFITPEDQRVQARHPKRRCAVKGFSK
jgi:hypothetical protein